jgi:hypothetical protein
MKTFFLVSSHPIVVNLCNSLLDEQNFHQSIKIEQEGRAPHQTPAWEMSGAQLRAIWESARHSDVKLADFRVATRRSLRSETIRWAQTEEWNPVYTSRSKRGDKLKTLLARKKTAR